MTSPSDDAERIITSQPPPEPGSELALPGEVMPNTLHLLPLTERPFFPAQSVPVLMNDTPWMDSVKAIGDTAHHLAGLVLVDTGDADRAEPGDFRLIGTAVRMHHPMRSSGKIQFIAEGLQRFRIQEWISREPPYLVRVSFPDDVLEEEDQLKAYAIAIINTLKDLVPLNPLYSEELKFFLNRFNPNEPSALTDFAASLTTASREELQEVLETTHVLERMKKVLVLIKKELEVARLQVEIREQVEEKMTEQQRKFFLREQLKAIQKELGISKDDKTADIDRFKQRLESLDVPEAVQGRIDDELQKFSVLESGSPEYAVTRNYLDWMTSMPWGKYSEDNFDLDHARQILARDHDGLEDVKDRIIEFLAIGSLKGEVAGSILLLVGPPGVGKTSIGRSVADALGRRFYRFSLGGMRDEAEIKGHRRTYIGAMPGKFAQALKEAGVANPVIMLDEIDKIGASFQGDPASALLEVLDPEQNSEFLDHYLDVRLDLSRTLFMCTANQLDTIPSPLLDRMEIIRLSGYITEEKALIARHHLWPRQLDKAGIPRTRLQITDAAIRRVIEGYAREAGVRGLEKQLRKLIRKTAVQFVSKRSKTGKVRIGVSQVEEMLGKPVFTRERPFAGVGIVTGLAWTPLGGATLNIEATLVHSKNRGFKLTGQLGEVMRESADIAYSYVASHLKEFGARLDFFDEAFVHLHVPEGATPKDGPSAGITIATALLSLARGQRIRRPVAMTGELTLTGRVLPVGGIREKVIAARRNRIFELILPEANRRDYEELPEHITEKMSAHFAGRYQDVASLVFPE
ncbi:endopeptidase La [Thiohalobacter thiocyanaticus]|uniref:Lon protease n=1 Tax=Thiohalobacter thiocyanaticus TaxID=585455 RepID=A0A426QLS0_9GAMM|nr:endopeptidase La [Thiohalobacter thiocyanaticus]RRQ22700.1 endopeptidase La [Thiohalobacter thiocyanaticus]